MCLVGANVLYYSINHVKFIIGECELLKNLPRYLYYIIHDVNMRLAMRRNLQKSDHNFIRVIKLSATAVSGHQSVHPDHNRDIGFASYFFMAYCLYISMPLSGHTPADCERLLTGSYIILAISSIYRDSRDRQSSKRSRHCLSNKLYSTWLTNYYDTIRYDRRD